MRRALILTLLCLATPLAAQGDPFARMRLDSAGGPADRLAGYLRTLAVSPRDVDALTGAGRAAMEVGDANAAIGFYARADGLSPRNGRIKAGLGAALLRMNRPRDAVRLFGDAVDLGVPEGDIASDRGLAWDLRGDPKKAQRDYAVARAAHGDEAETIRRLALSMGISGDRAGAITLLTPLLYKNDAAAWRARAFILAMTGDAPGAQAIAASVMPGLQAQAMQPFFTRLSTLNAEQKARAVHFGEMPSDGTAYSPTELAGLGGGNRAGSYRPENAVPAAGTATPARAAPPPPTAAWMRARARLLRNPPAAATPAPIRAPALVSPGPTIAPAATPETRTTVATRLAAKTAPSVGAALASAPVLAAAKDGDAPAATLVETKPAAKTRPAFAEAFRAPPLPRGTKAADPVATRKATRVTPVAEEDDPAPKGKASTKPADKAAASEGKKASGKDAEKTGKTAKDATAKKDEASGKGTTGKGTSTKGKVGKDDVADGKAGKGKSAKAMAKDKAADKPASERIWVQVAGGANKDDLPKAWDAAKAKAGAVLKGRAPSTTKVRATNRVLVGPFRTDAEAQGVVNKLPGAFIVRTAKGDTVEKLPTAGK